MRISRVLLAATAFMALFAFTAVPSQAHHMMSATLNYTPGGSAGEIFFDLTIHQRRSEWNPAPNLNDIIAEGGGGVQIYFGDGTNTPLLRFKVIAVDLANDIVVTKALAPGSNTLLAVPHTYANTAITYNAEAMGCCRTHFDIQENRATTSEVGETDGIEASMRLTTRVVFGNSNPFNTTPIPILNVCESAAATFAVTAIDPNGDNITYRFANNIEACNDATLNQPPNMSINSTTGLVTWNNVGLQQEKYWSVQVIAEDRTPAGAVKSWTPIDFLLKIEPCIPPFEVPGGSLGSQSCWPPNHKMVNVSANLTLDGGYTAVKLLSIICNEPENGLGDGNTVNDIQGAAFGTDDRQFQLRCERSGKGTGRVYLITYQFTGPNVEPMEMSFPYVVPHDQGKKKMVVTGGAEEAESIMLLYPSVPNPFMGSTQINYTLKQPVSSSLKIYSTAGEEIRTLSSGLQNAGTYTLTWDGRDNNGSDVPSGTYFYKLESPDCGCGTVMEMQLQR